MLRRRFIPMAMFVGLTLLGGPAFAHGTGYRQSEEKPLSLEFYYSTGETMSYLETKVFSPKDDHFAFQSGRTDEAGRFAFTPNAPGLWRVVVRDEEGHLAEAKINVTGGASPNVNVAAVSKPAVPEGTDLAVKAGLGVSLLFNIAALLSFTNSPFARRGKTSGDTR
jgi:nickel transport protein